MELVSGTVHLHRFWWKWILVKWVFIYICIISKFLCLQISSMNENRLITNQRYPKCLVLECVWCKIIRSIVVVPMIRVNICHFHYKTDFSWIIATASRLWSHPEGLHGLGDDHVTDASGHDHHLLRRRDRNGQHYQHLLRGHGRPLRQASLRERVHLQVQVTRSIQDSDAGTLDTDQGILKL